MIRPDAWRRLVKADPDLTARDKLVGLSLIEHRWRSGGYSRRETDLAAELGMHSSSIVRALRALGDAGYLAITVSGRKGVQQVYALTRADVSASQVCLPESESQLGSPDKLTGVSARHRAVAETESQLGNPAYPSFKRVTDAATQPPKWSAPESPRSRTTQTRTTQHPARSAPNVSTESDDEWSELHAASGAT